MAEFYRSVPGLQLREWQYDANNRPRSAWFQIGHQGILMLELDEIVRAPRALVWALAVGKDGGPDQPAIRNFINSLPAEQRAPASEHTLYFKDPDGNLLGFSAYPDKLTVI